MREATRETVTMAQFQGVVSSSRGTETAKSNPDFVALNGWNSGVRVMSRTEGREDVFEVWATGGSNSPGGKVLLGTVRGGLWTPAPPPEQGDGR